MSLLKEKTCLRVTNLKFSFKVNHILWKEKQQTALICLKRRGKVLKEHANLWTFQLQETVKIVVFKNGHINAMVRDQSQMKSCIHAFCFEFYLDSERDIYAITLDNIVANTQLVFKEVSMLNWAKFMLQHAELNPQIEIVNVIYSVENLSCAQIKTRYGLIKLFRNGKVTFMGVKSTEHLMLLWEYVKRETNHFLG